MSTALGIFVMCVFLISFFSKTDKCYWLMIAILFVLMQIANLLKEGLL